MRIVKTWDEISWEENFIFNTNKRFWKRARNWENVENTAIQQNSFFLKENTFVRQDPTQTERVSLISKWSVSIMKNKIDAKNCTQLWNKPEPTSNEFNWHGTPYTLIDEHVTEDHPPQTQQANHWGKF